MRRAVFPFLWVFPVILTLNALLPSIARTEGIDLRGEFTYSSSDSTTTNNTTGEALSSTFSNFRQLYNFDLSKTIYPYLTFRGGAYYDVADFTSTTGEIETETEEKLLRPYVRLELNNPIYKAGLGYRKTSLEQKTTGIATTKDFRDEFNGRLGFQPLDLPELNLRYDYTHTYDDPEIVDNIERFLTVNARYTALRGLLVDYIYTREEREDNINGFETLNQTHGGKIDYSRYFLNGRIAMNTGYRIRHTTLENLGMETTESAILRAAGFSGLSNTPEDGPALSPNNALVNGDRTASAGIDIGLAGDETTFTNMALDFGFSTSVNKIRIWVDRRLSSSVANSFSWTIYTSPDNMDTSTWTEITTIFPASFGTLDNRFDLSFTEVNTRFIKVVTRALSPLVPDAANFPNIFVTEMEAFTTPSGQDTQMKDTTVNQDFNFNLTGRLTSRTNLGYNFYYSSESRDLTNENWSQLTNGLNFNHIFNQVYSARASFSRTDEDNRGVESIIYNYGASLQANFLETFGQTLSFSGQETKEDLGTTSRNSFFLRTNAILYQGWSVFADTGYTRQQLLDRRKTNSITFRLGTDFVPNQMINFNLSYAGTATKNPDEDNGKTVTSRGEVQLFFVPFRALSFFARLSLLNSAGNKTTLQNYSANWSPFPDGAMQFFFTYNETLRPETDQRERTIGPRLKWSIGRHAILDVVYAITKSDNNINSTDLTSLYADLKLIF